MLKKGLLAAVATCAMGIATDARACPVSGQVVCANNGAPLQGAVVNFWAGYDPTFSGTTDALGDFSTSLWYVDRTYAVTLDLTSFGAGLVSEPSVSCVAGPDGEGLPITGLLYQVDVPACHTTTADCSPGYYKNHPQTWCDTCLQGVGCDQVVQELSAQGPGSAAIRDAAKAMLDACFGTAEASPCVDDNL